MVLNGLFDSLRLNTDIALCGGCAAVLQQSLDKDNVIAVGHVDTMQKKLSDYGYNC